MKKSKAAGDEAPKARRKGAARSQAVAPQPRGGDARDALLDAAERLLSAHGPDGVRLSEVAAEVGVTHPLVHYHFGSREGLLAALFQRTSERMRAQIVAALAEADAPLDEAARRALFLRVYDLVADPSRAPTLAALLATGGSPFADSESFGLSAMAEQLHALRMHLDPRSAGDAEGTRFGFMALVLLMFGDLLLGASTRRRLGLGDDEATRQRFRSWLADLLPVAIDAMTHRRPSP